MTPYGAREASARRAVDRWVVERFGAFLRVLVALGFAPWVITLAGLALAVTGALLAPLAWWPGVGLHLAGCLLDAVDGAAARASGRASLRGAALDVWADWAGSAAWVASWGAWRGGSGAGGVALLYALGSWWLLGSLEILAAQGRSPSWVIRPRVPVLAGSAVLWWFGADLGVWVPVLACVVVAVAGRWTVWVIEGEEQGL